MRIKTNSGNCTNSGVIQSGNHVKYNAGKWIHTNKLNTSCVSCKMRSFPFVLPQLTLTFLLSSTTMPTPHVPVFLHKKPCMNIRILDETDCPPHNTLHDIADYPKYYDTLYHPEQYPVVFCSPESIVSWMEEAVLEHSRHCLKCKRMCLPGKIQECTVEYSQMLDFIISLTVDNGSTLTKTFRILAMPTIESVKFSWCIFLGSRRPHLRHNNLEFSNVQLMAYMIPIWLFYPSSIFHHWLSQLSYKDLSACVENLGYQKKQELLLLPKN
jgi:hypothetical protein